MSLWLFLNLSNSYLSINVTCINYAVCIHGWKVSVVFNRNYFSKLKDFSRLGALRQVTYTGKVVVSKKWREIDTLLLHTTNRNYHIAYRFVPFPTILENLEDHLPNGGLIKCNLTNICATLRRTIGQSRICLSFPK